MSPISAKVSETWSSASSGSITSSKEAAPSTPSSTNINKAHLNSFRDLHFSKDDYYAPFFIEDIYFGQDLLADTKDHASNSYNLDSSLYKLWADLFGDKFSESVLKERISRSKVFFPTPNPVDSKVQYKNSYDLVDRIKPYPNWATCVQNRAAKLNYCNPCIVPRVPQAHNLVRPNVGIPHAQHPNPSWNKFNYSDHYSDVPLVVFPSPPACSAEEALNKYFGRQCNFETRKLPFDPDLNNLKSDFSFPISRTSTPINNSLKENQSWHASSIKSLDIAGGLPTDCNAEFKNFISNFKTEDKLARQEPGSCENFTQTEKKAEKVVPAAKPAKNKQYEFCKFCYKNGELSDIYMSHITKSSNGEIKCPILRKYVCDICGATGDKAHTRKYCTLNTHQETKQPVFRRLTNGVLTSCHNHK